MVIKLERTQFYITIQGTNTELTASIKILFRRADYFHKWREYISWLLCFYYFYCFSDVLLL